MAANLNSLDCRDIDLAHEYFGANPGCLVVRPGNNNCVPWISIPEGCYALVTRTGGIINHPGSNSCVWPPGKHSLGLYDMFVVDVAHLGLFFLAKNAQFQGSLFSFFSFCFFCSFCFCLLNFSFSFPMPLVTKQHIVFDSPVKGCKTLDNVSVEIDNSVVFRIMGDEDMGEDPDLVKKFVYEVTPSGLQNQLENAIDEAIRTLARSMRHTEVYGLRSVTVASDADVTGGIQIMDEIDPLEAMKSQRLSTNQDDDEMESKSDGGNEDDDIELVGEHETKSEIEAQKANFKGQSATERMKKSLNRQFNSQGVQIVDVMITDVKLPSEQVYAMTNRTMQVSIKTEQKMSHKNEMQQEGYDQEIQTVMQQFNEERDKARVEGDQKMNEARVRLNSVRADAEKELNNIRNQMHVLVNSVNARTDREVAQLSNEANEIMVNMRTDTEASASRLRAENDLEIEEMLSSARLEVARNEAEASVILSEAEGRMAPMLHTKKDFETDMKKLEVYQAFGSNPDVIISPSQDHTVNTLLLCDKILEGEDTFHGTDQNDRCRILAEMMVMNTGTHTINAK